MSARLCATNPGRKPGMRLSIVTTLYRSAGHIDEFYARMTRAAAAITDDFEIVLVNDGSPDDSLEKAVALHRADPRVVVPVVVNGGVFECWGARAGERLLLPRRSEELERRRR
jgi:hypothetical protein